jgi:hypothetical protein
VREEGGFITEAQRGEAAQRKAEGKIKKEEAFPEEVGAVRELRQRKAYYRCCIPALAGFVRQRSIAPDGSTSMD